MNIFLRNWGFYSYKWKIPALIWSFVIGILLIITKDREFDNVWRILTSFFLQYWLLIAIFSKEKMDDERMKSVRYFSLKITLAILLASFYFFNGLNYPIHINGVYLGIYASVFYLILFNTVLWFDPKFVFKERTRKFIISENGSIIVFSVYTSLICFILIAYAYFSW